MGSPVLTPKNRCAGERSRPVRDGFGAAGAFNPAATREQADRLTAPVLVYAGEQWSPLGMSGTGRDHGEFGGQSQRL